MEHLKNLHFTPEQPFGLPLYPIFEKAFEATVGFPASKFEYVPQVSPLSTVNEGKLSLRFFGASE
jgi:fatty acid elongase 3